MSYSALTAVGLILALGCDLVVLRTRLITHRLFWIGYAIMLGFQLIVNGVLTGVQVVRYNPRSITGLRLAYAPIEDIGFGFSLILITVSCWCWLNRRWP